MTSGHHLLALHDKLSQYRISNELLKHLPVDKQQAFKESYLASGHVTQVLKNLMEEYYMEVLRSETKLDDFKDTDWSHKQAFRNGQRQAYQKLIDILTVTETK